MSQAGGHPLELIHYNGDSGKFEVGKAATDVLRGVRGPLAVVAVCGRARQGKSFILNQLLQTSGGFTIGSTHRPCTKGLWMWSNPVQRTAEDGSDYNLVRNRGLVPPLVGPLACRAIHPRCVCPHRAAGMTWTCSWPRAAGSAGYRGH